MAEPKRQVLTTKILPVHKNRKFLRVYAFRDYWSNRLGLGRNTMPEHPSLDFSSKEFHQLRKRDAVYAIAFLFLCASYFGQVTRLPDSLCLPELYTLGPVL